MTETPSYCRMKRSDRLVEENSLMIWAREECRPEVRVFEQVSNRLSEVAGGRSRWMKE